jgi:signal transduction histidine kinase
LRGYTADEVMAVSMTHALANDAAAFVRALMTDRVAALEAAEAAAASGDATAAPGSAFYTEEVEQPCKDGSTVWTEVITNFYRDPASGRVKVRGVTRDISERRRAEEERARLGAHLQQAQKMESVGRLAGGIAHDFNNMLSVILGNIELALHEVTAGTQVHADLLEVQRAARHSADITRQLLAYARRQPVSPTMLDINASVGKSLSLLRPLLGEDLAVQWQPGAGLWPVLMDAAQLDQVVTNLCVNARDAVVGAGRLTLSTDNVSLDAAFCAAVDDAIPGDYVRLTVTDDGVGMPPEIIGKIFEPFFTTKGVGEGTGLGLATVYGAVRQNGGFVRVASEAGLGTTFDVYLPRHIAALRAVAEPVTSGPPQRGHDTILLVEDETSILRLATRALTAYGYTVLGARSPDEALRVAASYDGEIHLILTDVVMPVMNGRQLADALRLARPGIACLFMSGYSGAVLYDHGVGDDVPFIAKPFALRSLAEKVRAVLDEARAANVGISAR